METDLSARHCQLVTENSPACPLSACYSSACLLTTCLLLKELSALGSDEKARHLARFFKTGKGQYGEGDRFLGLPVPLTRSVAQKHKDVSLATAEALLLSEWHEARLCALLIMAEKMKRAKADEAELIYKTYLANTHRINNWDLVDLSAPQVVGKYLDDKPRDILYELASSPLLWDNRIAIVSTFAFIKKGYLDDTFALALRLIGHKHDLMHKAAGWMLREAGKRDFARLRRFVYEHVHEMPRTMLRYAIEKFPEDERRAILKM